MSKSMKLGGGGRFAALKKKIESEGESAHEAGAVAYEAGAKKYGAKKMHDMSAKGRLRKALKYK